MHNTIDAAIDDEWALEIFYIVMHFATVVVLFEFFHLLF